MANPFGNTSMRTATSLFLNKVDDPAPGVPLASPSGSIVQSYAGMLGQTFPLTAKEALALSDTAVGTLFAGIYQYVKIKLTATVAPARGLLVFWDDIDNFVVTTDSAAGNLGLIAGVLIGAPTKGNFCFIQVAGKANVKAIGALTKVAVAGDLCIVDQTPTGTFDVLADATGLNSVTVKSIVGVAIAAPVAGTITTVMLKPQALLNVGGGAS